MNAMPRPSISSLRWVLVWITLISTSSITSSCGDQGFDPKSLVNSYRLLNIKADPPTINVFQTSQLTAFDFHPTDLIAETSRPEITYEWRLCLFSAGSLVTYKCFVEEIILESDQPTVSIEPLSLLETLSELDLNLTEPMGDTQGQMMDLGGLKKLDVYIKFKATPKGEAEFEAVKTLTINLDPTLETNQNPKLRGIRRTPDFPSYVVGAEIELEALIEEGSAETYLEVPTPSLNTLINQGLTPDGGDFSSSEDAPEQTAPQEVTEELIFAWLVTGGEVTPPIVLSADPISTFTAPDEPGLHRIYLTVRDGRGGVDTAMTEFEVIDTPDR
jgi:hypothetical protein